MKATRSATLAAVLAAASLLAGCGGGGGAGADDLTGRWTGTLTISYEGGGGLAGGLTLQLDQHRGFFSGEATFEPIAEVMSIAGPVDGTRAKLELHFRCTGTDEGGNNVLSTEVAVLSASVSGNTLNVSGATGRACSLRGRPNAVAGASGRVTRIPDGIPL